MSEARTERGYTMVRARKTVCVQGLGFVGAAMAVAVAGVTDKSGEPLYNVCGIDLPTVEGTRRIDALNAGRFPFETTDAKLVAATTKVATRGNLWATSDPSELGEADVVVSDVNLDVQYDEEGEPFLDLSMYRSAVASIGEHVKPGALVLVETTVPPGTCEKVVVPIVDQALAERGLPPGSVMVAHSYERVMPGEHYLDSIVNYWRVYSGITEKAANACRDFLETVVNTQDYPLTRLRGTTASETAKVLENSYRATTIAFIDEWSRFAEAAGVDLYEVVDAVRMRPTHSNMRTPGFGVGGYCLTKDPYFAFLAAKDLWAFEGMDFPFSTAAVRTNNASPLRVLDMVREGLGGSLAGRRVLLCGVSYRQDVGDTRHSPSEVFAKKALAEGAILTCTDPLVERWEELGLEVASEASAEGFDAVVFAVPHRQYRDIDVASWLGGARPFVLDAFDALTAGQRDALAEAGCSVKCIGRG